MRQHAERHPIRGILAGVAGGLVASWIMNEFMSGPGKQLTKAIQTPEEKQQQAQHEDDSDATMKTADAIAATVTGGQHLTYEQEQKSGPIVHYAFGALAGGLYGGLAEYSRLSRSGFGTSFGTALFAGADLFAVPAFHLATPFAAHMVYGATTELVRRLVRRVL